MTIIKIAPLENGAHSNQTISGRLRELPEGWLEVPDTLLSQAQEYLPWVNLTVENGVITDITENTEAKAAWEELMEQQAQAEAETQEEGGEANG